MQLQQQLREVHSMLPAANSNDVSILFERTAFCRGNFNESQTHAEVIKRIRVLGQDYYGVYTILVGDLTTLVMPPPFSWKPHDRKQRGLGFVLGETTDGTAIFPPRCFSLLPPDGVDIEEMWHLLNDRRVAKRPKLIPVPQALKEDIMSIPTGTNPLALGLAKFKAHEERLAKSSANCEALRIEIAALETQAASQPTLEQLVAERLKEYGLDPKL